MAITDTIAGNGMGKNSVSLKVQEHIQIFEFVTIVSVLGFILLGEITSSDDPGQDSV